MTVLLAPVRIHDEIGINFYYTQGFYTSDSVRQRLINQIHVNSCSHRQLHSFTFCTEALSYMRHLFIWNRQKE